MLLVGKAERKRPLGRPRLKLGDNINIRLQKVRWGAWTELIWLRIRTCGVVL